MESGPQRAPRLPRRDLLVAAIYLAVVVSLGGIGSVGVSTQGLLEQGPLWPGTVSIALLLPAALATALRHRAPAVTLVVTGVLSCAEVLGGSTIGGYVLLFEALWSPVAYGSRRLARVTSGAGVAISIAMLAVASTWPQPGPSIIVGLLLIVVVVGTPLAWGWEVRHLHLARATAERLASAEQELAAERAERAVETERRRLAQDLHDVLSGHLSAVALHAGLAAQLPSADARERSLATARESAQAALRDLRSVITMLTDEGTTEPEVTLSWAALAARLDAGAHVADGADRADRADRADWADWADGGSLVQVDPVVEDPAHVDPTLRAALLRIGAEAVANALAHGRPPRRLEVSADADAAHLICTNAFVPGRIRADDSPGLGLTTMRSRALAVGGSLAAGPDAADPRTWRVEVRVPTTDRTPLMTEDAP
jgi:signal transduction histidine kinase